MPNQTIFKMKKIYFFTYFLLLSFCTLAQSNPCDTYTKSKDNNKGTPDTTITLPNGTQLTFNRCEYFDIAPCVEIKEIRTLADVVQSGYNTIDDKGNILLTCGMLKLNFKNGDCTEECLTIPVRIRIPILANPCANSTNANQLYKINSNGVWQAMDEPVKEVTDASGKKYFEFYTKCGNAFNCDKKLPTVKVKFKAKKIKSLTNINITSHCPIINVNFFTTNRRKVIFAKLPCLNPDSLIIKIIGTNKQGNPIEKIAPLSSLFSKYRRTECRPISNKIVRNILGIFKTKERYVYKKYLVN